MAIDLEALRRSARSVPEDGRAPGELLELIGDARFVLIGEASHGTHEFYALRADLTRRLVAERGFHAVAVEADWPDAAGVNHYVRGDSDDPDAEAALGGFIRFPRWMWRNTVVAEFVGWLADHNTRVGDRARRAGFYGLDLYSLYSSIEAVIDYLDTVDPEAAARARLRYACFDHTGIDAQRYGYATAMGRAEPCEDEVVEQFVELQRRAADYASRDGRLPEDAFFNAQQNASLVADAERYYRSMFRGRDESWNLRDTHMADTLDSLVNHLSQRVSVPKVIVWAHNSHLGDARATEMGQHGELNLGQLVRERHGDAVVSIGFSTYTGEVTAASDWGGPVERKRVQPGIPGSYEAVLHDVGRDRFWLNLRDHTLADTLHEPRLERAIGVIYRPETERISHYFRARLVDQFDAVIHCDTTSALEPLDPVTGWEAGKAPETYPRGV